MLSFPENRFRIVAIKSSGDRDRKLGLDRFPVQGIFCAEIERRLRRGGIDMAVHSLKDVPTAERADLVMAAYPRRADPADALLTKKKVSLKKLKRGASVGTSSLRRHLQLLRARPDLKIRPLRGNVTTRVSQVAAGKLDAAVLAMAGLKRLGMGLNMCRALSLRSAIPCAGQGILGIQVRRSDHRLRRMVAFLDDAATRQEAAAERSCLKTLGGGCRVPVGILARSDGRHLRIRAAVYAVSQGHDLYAEISGRSEQAGRIGIRAARELIRRGAGCLLKEARQKAGRKPVIITRPRGQSDDFKAWLKRGRVPVAEVPTINIKPCKKTAGIKKTLSQIANFEWLVFTSVNGVDAFFRFLKAFRGRGFSLPAGLRLAAIGPATRSRIRRHTRRSVLMPRVHTSEGLVKVLKSAAGPSKGGRVLMARADIAGRELPAGLRGAGARVKDLAVYRTVPEDSGGIRRRLRRALVMGADKIAFTSPSTALYFANAIGRKETRRVLREIKVFSIGPVTTRALRRLGVRIAGQARRSTVRDLAELIQGSCA